VPDASAPLNPTSDGDSGRRCDGSTSNFLSSVVVVAVLLERLTTETAPCVVVLTSVGFGLHVSDVALHVPLRPQSVACVRTVHVPPVNTPSGPFGDAQVLVTHALPAPSEATAESWFG